MGRPAWAIKIVQEIEFLWRQVDQVTCSMNLASRGIQLDFPNANGGLHVVFERAQAAEL